MKIIKRKLLLLLFIAGVCLPGQVFAQRNTIEAPNIVFIIGDDISADDFGCYGNKQVKTPNIDRIAKDGLRFTNAYLTSSSCSPSRSSILSGRYPHNNGAAELHTPLPSDIAIFPELLKKAGYYTAQAGKWHMGESAKRGFDIIHDNGKENGDGGEEMWVTTLKERPKEKPFFMWFASLDAHRPWGPNRFRGENSEKNVIPPIYNANTTQTREDLAHYYDEISRLDDYIGQVELELEKQGVLDNTIIIVMSDNGRPFPRAKTRVYDSGMQTPLVFKWAGANLKEGAVSDALISVIDIAPTLLELAGVKGVPAFQGKSFAKVIRNPSREFRKYVFAEHNWHDYQAAERMVRTKNHLYVLNLRPALSNPGAADVTSSPSFQDLKELRDAKKLSLEQADVFMVPRPSEELYDCRKDPEQLINVAPVATYSTDLKTLRSVMLQWRNETGDSDSAELTQDWFDREDGKLLKTKHLRGEMPGKMMNATKNNHKGPF